MNKIFAYICISLISITAFAYEDDYIWVEKFKRQLPIAEKGDPEAQYDIATMYEKGNGVKKDYKQAFEWYLKSAKGGNTKASFQVGEAYYQGKGVLKAYDKARKWFVIAADKGYSRAQYYLGEIYEQGNGVSKDYDQALEWYQKAKNGGNSSASDNIDDLKKKIAAQQRVNSSRKTSNRPKSPPTAKVSQQKIALKRSKNDDTIAIKAQLLDGGWEKRNKPAEYLPSKYTKCKDKGNTIECISKELERNIGMADIKYTTKAILYGIKGDDKSFKVSYRNNVLDIKVTDAKFLESGGRVPVKLGWQDAEHTLSCTLDSQKTLSCKKNKLRRVKFTRD